MIGILFLSAAAARFINVHGLFSPKYVLLGVRIYFSIILGNSRLHSRVELACFFAVAYTVYVYYARFCLHRVGSVRVLFISNFRQFFVQLG